MAAATFEYSAHKHGVSLTPYTIVQFLVFWPLFFYFVSKGWYLSALQSMSVPLSWLCGVFFATTGLLCVWTIGRNYVPAQGNPILHLVNLCFGVVLLMISTLGNTNTMLNLSEGNTIYAEALIDANAQLSKLRATADTVLVTPTYTKLSSKVNDAWAIAKAEMATVQRCGEGEDFKRLFSKVEASLGATSGSLLLSGARLYGEGQCSSERVKQEITQRQKEYGDVIKDKLSQSDAFQADKVVERTQLKKNLQHDVDAAVNALTQMQKQLNDADSKARENSLDALEKANSDFVKYRAALSSIAADGVKELPQRLDLKMAKGLGSLSHVFGIFLSQWSDVWGYALVALIFDVFVVGLAILRRKLWLQHEQAVAAIATAAANEQVNASKLAQASSAREPKKYLVKHLWVPAPQETTTA